MNTYKAVQLHTGEWGVHRYADGICTGLVQSGFQSEAEALHAVYRLALAEISPEDRGRGEE